MVCSTRRGGAAGTLGLVGELGGAGAGLGLLQQLDARLLELL